MLFSAFQIPHQPESAKFLMYSRETHIFDNSKKHSSYVMNIFLTLCHQGQVSRLMSEKESRSYDSARQYIFLHVYLVYTI